MKILLTTQRVECEAQQIDLSHGICYLTSVLRMNGHEVKVLDCDATITDIDSIKKSFREEEICSGPKAILIQSSKFSS